MAKFKTKKQNPKVAILISCRDESQLCAQLLPSLKSQTLDFALVLDAHEDFPRRANLAGALKEFDYLFFLDEDVYLPHEKYLENTISLLEQQNQLRWLGGKYLSKQGLSYWSQGYNFIVNYWIDAGSQTPHFQCPIKTSNLAGGIWAVRNCEIPWHELHTDFWGGEDTWILRKFQSLGGETHYHPELDVFHEPNTSLRHFLKRAWRHGLNRHRLQLQTPHRQWKLSWDLIKFLPVLFFHQLCVEFSSYLGKLIHARS